MKIELNDSEWMSVIDMDRGGLPSCCADISDLRDSVIAIIRNGCSGDGYAVKWFIRSYQWCALTHDMSDLEVVNKIYQQAIHHHKDNDDPDNIKEGYKINHADGIKGVTSEEYRFLQGILDRIDVQGD